MVNANYTIYRIFYGEHIVYVGRTKQPLQNRIRGHLFSKPMHRTIYIDQVSRIEYAELQTEADMNLYELYYILMLRPALNVDDKAKDQLTVSLPELVWKEFKTPLWDKWLTELHGKDADWEKKLHQYQHIPEELTILRSAYRMGQISEDEFYAKADALKETQKQLRKDIFG